jgi:outer membrane protein assembly factor BamA
LRKIAGIPTFVYRPTRDVVVALSPTVEYNEALIFHQRSIQEYLESGSANTDIARLLRVPDGGSTAFAQRAVVTWDRRDSSFNPRHGTYFVSGVEHVDWQAVGRAARSQDDSPKEGHFFRFTETFAGYVPVGRRLTFAAELRLGWNVQLTNADPRQTYPDRLFFLGGFESMRGWYQDTFIPQDYMDQIRADARDPTKTKKLTPETLPLRGGNLMINPKFELRIPLGGAWETVAFADIGNLWLRPSVPFDTERFPIRAAVGSGIRYQTPIGPAALDYGFNVTRYRPEEELGAVQFSIGIF